MGDRLDTIAKPSCCSYIDPLNVNKFCLLACFHKVMTIFSSSVMFFVSKNLLAIMRVSSIGIVVNKFITLTDTNNASFGSVVSCLVLWVFLLFF